MSTRSERRARRAPKRFGAATIIPMGATIVLLAIIAAIAIVNRKAVGSSMPVPLSSNLSVGDSAPNFSVATSQGQFSLASTTGPVLLEVFATWCPHCQHETVVMNKLYAAYGDRVHFVAVSGSPLAMNHSSPESQADVDAFVQFFQVRYPVAFDQSLDVANAYIQAGFPTIVLIGSDKRVKYLGTGEIAEATLAHNIRSMLARRR